MNRKIRERALAGDGFKDIFIADCHCHMGTWYDFYFPSAGIDEMMSDADAMCIDEIYISPHASISCDYKLGNAQLEEAVEKYLGRAFGYLVLNPNKPDEIAGQFERYYSRPDFVGVKIHPGLHHYPITGKNYLSVFEMVKQCGGFVLTHTWDDSSDCSIEMCREIIRAYPGIALILGHAGGFSAGVKKSVDLVNEYENAFLDTSGFEYSNVWIEDIAAKADPAKILFGSDYPFHDLRGGLARILFADIADEMKTHILGRNFKELRLKYAKRQKGATEC